MAPAFPTRSSEGLRDLALLGLRWREECGEERGGAPLDAMDDATEAGKEVKEVRRSGFAVPFVAAVRMGRGVAIVAVTQGLCR